MLRVVPQKSQSDAEQGIRKILSICDPAVVWGKDPGKMQLSCVWHQGKQHTEGLGRSNPEEKHAETLLISANIFV